MRKLLRFERGQSKSAQLFVDATNRNLLAWFARFTVSHQDAPTMSAETPSATEAVTDDSAAKFSFAEARSLIGDLTTPNPRVYWTDFLLSIFGGYITLNLTMHVPRLFWPQPWVIPVVIVSYLATVVLFMRAVMFTHELVHLPKEGFKAFRIVWNVLCGIPSLSHRFFTTPTWIITAESTMGPITMASTSRSVTTVGG